MPRKTILGMFTITAVFVTILLVEVALKTLLPYSLATIGHRYSNNSQLYGWGFSPGETLRVLNPDTGEIYSSPANNHGWRDRDRHFENPRGAYRILVLGDSNTYGAIVADTAIYTRVLEQELEQAGCNAEVISIGYGRWGTDQQLEALVNEGVSYSPDLIIVQFCTNDLSENSYYSRATEPGDNASNLDRGLKPFYYDLDEGGRLRRNVNPFFRDTLREKIKRLSFSSEIFKRAYAVYSQTRLRRRVRQKESEEAMRGGTRYRVTPNQLLQLETAVGLSEDSALHALLRKRQGDILEVEELSRVIDASQWSEQKTVILRILEDRWFHDYWSISEYRPPAADPNSYEWRLYFALIDEIARLGEQIGADVAVFPATEEGQLQWNLSWYRTSDDEISRTNFLNHIDVITAAMAPRGIDVIRNTRIYERARNDGHPSEEGNGAMAEDIWSYLVRNVSAIEECMVPGVD